ncbi:MAG: FAD-dependent oxidoreductase [Candidatus Omnitrophica bacterium]|nr:FAD-dependent oxidoreductase [Candidatus Omnitrophota bacterium]
MIYDLIIIGAGPAGITASVYAARKRMNFLVISKDIGGQTAWSGDIENYTGYQFITGPDLTAKFQEHIKKYNVEVKEEEVLDLRSESKIIKIKTDKAIYESKTVIVASGKTSMELGVPGENEFKNKGLTYCATCDGPLFSGKKVAVIGGGNSGLDAAIQLMKIAEHIYLINITDELTGDPIMQQEVRNSDKVTILNKTQAVAVFGDKFVKGIEVETKGKSKSMLEVAGIFVEIGLVPNSGFAKELEKNEADEIKVNSFNETNIPGVFAAGDVTDVPEKQIVIAAGEGSKAALSAFKYLIHNRARLKE